MKFAFKHIMELGSFLQKSAAASKLTKSQQKQQRNKLVRTTASIEQEASSRCSGSTHFEGDVMGGGFATPHVALQYTTAAASNTAIVAASAAATLVSQQASAQMHDKSAAAAAKAKANETATKSNSKTEKSKEKTEKDKDKTSKKDTPKFAEKLRRSFRRAEHKSLDIKGSGSQESTLALGGHKSAEQPRLAAGFPKHSHSIFSLSNLPGLASVATGGHINPALLLDSPDESTPPEYAYQHLSSVATTNSSTSLESNCELGEKSSSQSSIQFWAWQQTTTAHNNNNNHSSSSNNNMGGELSTSTNTDRQRSQRTTQLSEERKEPKPAGSVTSATAAAAAMLKLEKSLSAGKTETSTHSELAPSRSCSINSDSSSAKLTRLSNFLFKSSNESTRSYQGHSNEAFTASSHNSSSGEWENLCSAPYLSHDNALSGSFTEETIFNATQESALQLDKLSKRLHYHSRCLNQIAATINIS